MSTSSTQLIKQPIHSIALVALLWIGSTPAAYADMAIAAPPLPNNSDDASPLTVITMLSIYVVVVTVCVVMIEYYVMKKLKVHVTLELLAQVNVATLFLGFVLTAVSQIYFETELQHLLWEGRGLLGLVLLCLTSAGFEHLLIMRNLGFRPTDVAGTAGSPAIRVVNVFPAVLVANVASYVFLYTFNTGMQSVI